MFNGVYNYNVPYNYLDRPDELTKIHDVKTTASGYKPLFLTYMLITCITYLLNRN